MSLGMLISTKQVLDMFPFFCVSCSSIISTLDEDTKGAWENNNGSLLLANVVVIVFQCLHYFQVFSHSSETFSFS